MEWIVGEDKKLWDRIAAIETKTYIESAVQTNEEPKMQWRRLKAFARVEKRKVAPCPADLDCRVIDKAAFAQITNEANGMCEGRIFANASMEANELFNELYQRTLNRAFSSIGYILSPLPLSHSFCDTCSFSFSALWCKYQGSTFSNSLKLKYSNIFKQPPT